MAVELTFEDLASESGFIKKVASDSGTNSLITLFDKIMANSGTILTNIERAKKLASGPVSSIVPNPPGAPREIQRNGTVERSDKPKLTGTALLSILEAKLASINDEDAKKTTILDVKQFLIIGKAQIEAQLDEELKKWAL